MSGRTHTPRTRTPRRLLPPVPTDVLVALLALLIAASITVVVLGREKDDATAAIGKARPPVSADSGKGYRTGSLPGRLEAPVEAAVKAMPLALGYNYRSLAKGLDRATALMTRDFGTEFRRTFSKSAASLARSKQAVTSATVRAAGLVRANGDRATCVVYVDQALVSSTTLKRPDAPVRVAQNRVLVTLQHGSKGWLVDSLEPF